MSSGFPFDYELRVQGKLLWARDSVTRLRRGWQPIIYFAAVVCVPAPAGQGGVGARLADSSAHWLVTHCLLAGKAGAGAQGRL
jgi:hypothetical protein